MKLKPAAATTLPQKKDGLILSSFNGDYDLMAVDSNSTRLDYTFTYSSLFDWRNFPGESDYINLLAIDGNHLKATLFKNGKAFKSKTIKGVMRNNHFEFHNSRLSMRYVFFRYAQQTNRISLSNEGNLFLDTNRGGIGFLLILPIPLSGSSMDEYDLKFNRRQPPKPINKGI